MDLRAAFRWCVILFHMLALAMWTGLFIMLWTNMGWQMNHAWIKPSHGLLALILAQVAFVIVRLEMVGGMFEIKMLHNKYVHFAIYTVGPILLLGALGWEVLI
jgi:hypothetical protein